MLSQSQKAVTARLGTALVISCHPCLCTLQGKSENKIQKSSCTLQNFSVAFSRVVLRIIVAVAAALPSIFIFLADPNKSIAQCFAFIDPNY